MKFLTCLGLSVDRQTVSQSGSETDRQTDIDGCCVVPGNSVLLLAVDLSLSWLETTKF